MWGNGVTPKSQKRNTLLKLMWLCSEKPLRPGAATVAKMHDRVAPLCWLVSNNSRQYNRFRGRVRNNGVDLRGGDLWIEGKHHMYLF